MQCAKCSYTGSVKNGKQGGKQRYRCSNCGSTYTEAWQGKDHPLVKQLAVMLHLNGLGFRRIAQMLGVSHVSVQKWWRTLALHYQSCSSAGLPESFEVVEIDELWHYCRKKNAKSGFGLLWIELAESSSLGSWLLVGKSL